jgi:hypothetical protein
MAFPRPTEPDRFLPYTKNVLPKGAVNVTAADWRNLRACFVAAGLHQSDADQTVRYIESRGGVFAWSGAAPDAIAVQARNWGYAFTRIGIHKDKASTLVRTFALLGNGLGGPTIATFTIPAIFKTPV